MAARSCAGCSSPCGRTSGALSILLRLTCPKSTPSAGEGQSGGEGGEAGEGVLPDIVGPLWEAIALAVGELVAKERAWWVRASSSGR